MDRIYLDHAADTDLREEVVQTLLPYFLDTSKLKNPSGKYKEGKQARRTIEEAREKVASVLNCEPKEIYFTSGGTEANNWIAFQGYGLEHNGFLCSAIEHSSLSKHMKSGEKVEVRENGLVDEEKLRVCLDYFKGWYSIMLVNNEIGVIQNITKLSKMIHRGEALIHTDAVQAVGVCDLDVKKLGVDAMTISGHKFGAPMGVGALFVSSKQKWFRPLIEGGQQERGLRGGTENLPYIAAFGEAIVCAEENRELHVERLWELRKTLIDGLMQIEGVHVNTFDGAEINPAIISVTVENVESASMVAALNLKGVCASSGSACNSFSYEPSRVLTAIGMPKEKALCTLRLSLGRTSTEWEMVEAVKRFKAAIEAVEASTT